MKHYYRGYDGAVSCIEHKDHKYTKREWVNGKWRYWYDDGVGGNPYFIDSDGKSGSLYKNGVAISESVLEKYENKNKRESKKKENTGEVRFLDSNELAEYIDKADGHVTEIKAPDPKVLEEYEKKKEREAEKQAKKEAEGKKTETSSKPTLYDMAKSNEAKKKEAEKQAKKEATIDGLTTAFDKTVDELEELAKKGKEFFGKLRKKKK